MASFLDRLFNKKPKNLEEQIELHFEDDIKKVLKESDEPLFQTILITRRIADTTQILKQIYSDVHLQLGYNREQYEKLVDSVCYKITSKYFPGNSRDDRDFEYNPADWAE